jgi:hypothetical protein
MKGKMQTQQNTTIFYQKTTNITPSYTQEEKEQKLVDYG